MQSLELTKHHMKIQKKTLPIITLHVITPASSILAIALNLFVFWLTFLELLVQYASILPNFFNKYVFATC